MDAYIPRGVEEDGEAVVLCTVPECMKQMKLRALCTTDADTQDPTAIQRARASCPHRRKHHVARDGMVTVM